MSFVAIAVGASAVIGAAGQIYAGQKQKAAANYNAKVQENQAETAFLESKERISRMRKQSEAQMGRALAIRAGQGVDISAGSSLMLEAENAEAMELSALEAGRSADINQRNLMSGAKITKMQGSAAAKASYFTAGASLLSGASKIGQIQTQKGHNAAMAAIV